ncbi:MAG: tetraacyldisaccharide 4'-kinase [Candidatus Omnitrophica bacterium]|nr:tetraacyldisaccharide 4'-kinase [Candidatus Omnitrophota bacterium]
MASFFKICLFLISGLYRLGLLVRSWTYALKFSAVYCSQRKVISVGNMTMGGVGKTPMVVYLVKALQKRKICPVVVTRGYMMDKAAEGDEVKMLREIVPGMAVYAGANRVVSIQQAEKDGAGEVFILDDGFQHWRVARDFDIVVLDAMCAFGNGQVLPRGILREPISSISRADVIVLARADVGRDNVASLREVCGRFNAKALVVEAVHEPLSVTNLMSGKSWNDFSVIKEDIGMVCAIGSPDNFRLSLEVLGAKVNVSFVYRDHYSYTVDDIKSVIKECRALGIRKLVTTHKDAVKLREFANLWDGVEVFVLDVEIRIIYGEAEFLSRIDRLFHS